MWRSLNKLIFFFLQGYHQSKEIGSDVTGEEIKHFQVACNEFLNRVIMVEASERAGKPIHKETIIFDCTHMGLWRKDKRVDDDPFTIC